VFEDFLANHAQHGKPELLFIALSLLFIALSWPINSKAHRGVTTSENEPNHGDSLDRISPDAGDLHDVSRCYTRSTTR